MLARETHEAEDANKRHEFRVAFNLARDGRVRATRCGEVANVTNSAYLDNVLANFDLIAAESLIGLHHSEVARLDLRAASAVLKTVGSASDATDDMRKEAAGLQRRTAKDLTELSR